jgi:putative oxidoreductase
MPNLSKYSPIALGVLRVVVALLFIAHGTQKLFGFPVAFPMPELPPLLLVAAILELVGGLLMLVGLFARPTAFILSGLMAFAYWMMHAPASFYPVANGGDAAVLFCFAFLYMVFAGPGAFSVDGMRARSAASATA